MCIRDSSFTYSQGLSLARVDTECVIEHPGVRFDFLSAYFLRLREHLDQSTFIHHKVGGSSSRQHFKGILDNSSRAVFSGRIRIEKGAQKAVSEQLNNNLLLSNMAEADSKPQLEIYADDVKATHGATVGSIDEEELFYLMSRAISARQARSMVAQGFLSGLVPAGLDQRVQGFLRKTMKEQLVEVGLP
ncbi:MAG: SufD family Fe-S cluster assembly protein, partial [Bdellovibrionaceae bacterium]|nr:SufD family Fe-S cluster assembly protein [Pseudobdellovibrionaceae bacterium]